MRRPAQARDPGRKAGVDPESRRQVVAAYERSLRRHGPNARALKWADEASQRERFRLLTRVGDWDGVSVADVGCGLGDLFGFLKEAGHEVRYTGYDLSRRMVGAAHRKYPEGPARFAVRDILATGLGGRFDYVVASGTFNLKLKDHDQVVRRMLRVMFQGCRRAVAFNLFHPYPDRRWTELVDWAGYYSVPLDEVLVWCRELSHRVEAGPGVSPHESTLFVYRA